MDADAWFYSFSALGSKTRLNMSILNHTERFPEDTELVNASF